MEVVRRVVLCCCCMAGFAATCEADGFFRRVPEVGEWAKYDLVMTVAIVVSSKDEVLDETPAMVGSLTLKCVGEETIDDIKHLWLEARMEVADPNGIEQVTLLKLLVPADQIVEGDIPEHAVRAWCADGQGAREMHLAGDSFLLEQAAFAVLNVFPASHPSAGRRQERTLTIDGQEVQLASYESADLPSREFGDADISGDAVWWPSADHAFGIAAAELEWNVIMLDAEEETTMTYTSQMDLVETGTDAESDLPDNN